VVLAEATSADYLRDPSHWGSAEVAALFPGFKHLDIRTKGAVIRLRHGGSGPPLLLLHGNSQNHATWFGVAARLAERYHVVLAQIRKQPHRRPAAPDRPRPASGSPRPRLRSFHQILHGVNGEDLTSVRQPFRGASRARKSALRMGEEPRSRERRGAHRSACSSQRRPIRRATRRRGEMSMRAVVTPSPRSKGPINEPKPLQKSVVFRSRSQISDIGNSSNGDSSRDSRPFDAKRPTFTARDRALGR
jgi:hypothetical protein